MGFCCVFRIFHYFWTTQKNPYTHPLTHPKTRGWVDILKNPGFFPTLIFCRSTKDENWLFFHYFFYIFASNWNFLNLMKITNACLKSWLKNLSNECIYAEQNLNITREICFQSWPPRSQKKDYNSFTSVSVIEEYF
jgi:hypothetical protein